MDENIGTELRYHSRFHGPGCLVLCVMRDIWRTVEKVVDPVTGISAHNGAAVGASDGLSEQAENRSVRNGGGGGVRADPHSHGLSQIAEQRSGFAKLDSVVQTLARCPNKFL